MIRSIFAASLLVLLPTMAFAQQAVLQPELPSADYVEIGRVVTNGNQRHYSVKFDDTNLIAVEHLYQQLDYVSNQKNKRLDMVKSDFSAAAGNSLVITRLTRVNRGRGDTTAAARQNWDAYGKMTFMFGLKEQNGVRMEQSGGKAAVIDRVKSSIIERSVDITFNYFANTRELIVGITHGNLPVNDNNRAMFPFSEIGMYAITGQQVTRTLNVSSSIEGKVGFEAIPKNNAVKVKLGIDGGSSVVQRRNVMSVRLSELGYTIRYGAFGIYQQRGAAGGNLAIICAAQWGTDVDVQMQQTVASSKNVNCATKKEISSNVSWSDQILGISAKVKTDTRCTASANTVPMSVTFRAQHEQGSAMGNALSSVFNLNVQFGAKGLQSSSHFQLKYGTRLHYHFKAEAFDGSNSAIVVTSRGTSDNLRTEMVNLLRIKN
ncbi:MAG: hypothetical protein ACRC8S_04935 [Fimbriiglobus sp.]